MIEFFLPPKITNTPTAAVAVPGGWLVCWARQTRTTWRHPLGTWFFGITNRSGTPKKVAEGHFMLGQPKIFMGKRPARLALLFPNTTDWLIYTKDGQIAVQNDDPQQGYIFDPVPPAKAAVIRKKNKTTPERELLCRAYGIDTQGVVVFDSDRNVTVNPISHEPIIDAHVAHDGMTIMVFGLRTAVILDNPLI